MSKYRYHVTLSTPPHIVIVTAASASDPHIESPSALCTVRFATSPVLTLISGHMPSCGAKTSLVRSRARKQKKELYFRSKKDERNKEKRFYKNQVGLIKHLARNTKRIPKRNTPNKELYLRVQLIQLCRQDGKYFFYLKHFYNTT